MKFSKKFFLLALASTFVISVSSCSTPSTRNNVTPMGNLKDTTVYASSNNGAYTVSQTELYQKLRSVSYNMPIKAIKETVFAKEIAAIDYAGNTDDHKDINDQILQAVFSSSNGSTIAGYTDDQIKTYKEKFIDNSLSNGLIVAMSDLNFSVSKDELGDYTVTADFPEQLVNYYKYNVALTRAAKDALLNSDYGIYNETITNTDGEEVSNPNYLNEKYDLKNKYVSSYKDYYENRSILVSFASKKQADEVYNATVAAVGELSDGNALQFYTTLYNNAYKYRTNLTTENYEESSYTLFRNDADHSDFSQAGVTTMFDALDDGEYFNTPFSIGGNYYMLYRIETKYKTGANKVIEYDNLKDELGETKFNEINAELKDEIVKSKSNTSFADTVFKNRLKECELSIYDPLVEEKFAASYEDYYTYVSTSNNDNIFTITYDGKETNYSVEDFFNQAANCYGVTYSLELLAYDYLLDDKNGYAEHFDEDVYNSNVESLDTAIDAFNKGENSSYPAELGLETFLVGSYGYATRDDVLKYYYKAAQLKSYFTSNYQYTNIVNNDTHEVVDWSLFDKFTTFASNVHSSEFSLNITHMLISIDDNLDGTMDDPTKFLAELSDENKELFKSEVTKLAQAISDEANYITTDISSAFKYIVSAFNDNEPLHSPGHEDQTWADFKKYFNFSLTTEELGDITNESSSNYVKPFADRVKELFSFVSQMDGFDEENGYLEFTDEAATYDTICTTTYGFHILNVNSFENVDSAIFKQDSDVTDSDKDGYNDYAHIKVTVKADEDKDTDDDNGVDDSIYAYVNAYNEDSTSPSKNQLFIYFYESLSTDGVVSLSSTLKSTISTSFTSVMTRYKNSTFQEYRLYSKLEGVTFADEKENTKYSLVLEAKKHSIDSYADTTAEDYIFKGWFDLAW